MLKNKTIAIGAMISFFGKVINSTFGYFALLMVALNLTEDNFGYYSVIGSIVVLAIQVASFGFDKTIIKYFPEWIASKSLQKNIKDLILFWLAITIVISFILNSVGYVFLVSQKLELLVGFLFIMTLNIGFQSFMIIVRSFNQVENKFIKAVLPEDYIRSAFFLFLLILTSVSTHDLSLLLIGVIYTISNGVSFLFSLKYFIDFLKKHNIKIRYSFNNNYIIPKFYNYSRSNMIGNLLFHSKSHLILVVASIIISPTEVGVLNVAIKTVAFISFILIAVRNVFGPKIANDYFTNNKEGLETNYKKITFVTSLFGILISIGLINSSEALMNVFGYNQSLILIIISISEITNVIFGSVTLYLVMLNKHRENVKILILGLISSLTMTLVLAPKFGVIGVGGAIFISNLISNLLGVYILKKDINIEILDKNSMYALISGFVTTVIVSNASLNFFGDKYLNIILVSVLTTFIYLLLIMPRLVNLKKQLN